MTSCCARRITRQPAQRRAVVTTRCLVTHTRWQAGQDHTLGTAVCGGHHRRLVSVVFRSARVYAARDEDESVTATCSWFTLMMDGKTRHRRGSSASAGGGRLQPHVSQPYAETKEKAGVAAGVGASVINAAGGVATALGPTAAGAAAAAIVVLLAPVAVVVKPCLEILDRIDGVWSLYIRAKVNVDIARVLAKHLTATLIVMLDILREMEEEIKDEKMDRKQRRSIDRARDDLCSKIGECRVVLAEFWDDLEPPYSKGLARILCMPFRATRRLGAQFKKVDAVHLPALKSQFNIINTSMTVLNGAIAAVRNKQVQSKLDALSDQFTQLMQPTLLDNEHMLAVLHKLDKLDALDNLTSMVQSIAHALAQLDLSPAPGYASVVFRDGNLPPKVDFFFDPNKIQRVLLKRLDASSRNGRYSLAAKGQGGVGKSVMAAECCHAATQDPSRYQLVWWVLAETRDSCAQSLHELIVHLNELCDDKQLSGNLATPKALARVLQHEVGTSGWIAAVMRLLERANASWLLVYDNYSRDVRVDDMIPRGVSSSTKRHHVLLTTRDADVDHQLDVPVWTPAQSHQFFTDIVFPRFTKNDDGSAVGIQDLPVMLRPENQAMKLQQVSDVCERVRGLPLAMSLIAHDLQREWRHNRLYDLRCILEQWDALAQQRKVDMANGKAMQLHTMDAILLMARDKLSRNDRLLASVDKVISSLAYVATDDIPVRVLRFDDEAVRWLVARSLVTSKDGAYYLHRLTQDAMRRRHDSSSQVPAIQRVLLALGKSMQRSQHADLRVRTHAAAALTWAHAGSVHIPREVKDVLKDLSLRTAIERGELPLVRQIHEANSEAMQRLDSEKLHAFHHAFTFQQIDIMHWLVKSVPWFRDRTVIKPTSRCTMTTLEMNSVSLSDDALAKLVESLAKVKSLTRLSLHSNDLKSLPTDVKALTSLTELILHSNGLVRLPAELGSLTQLRLLHLYDNHLQSLPVTVENLTQLTQLDLARNDLSSIPEQVGKLVRLKKLKLSYNHLTELPHQLAKLSCLEELHLDNNQLASLPGSLGNLAKLQYLSLFSNRDLTRDDLPPELLLRVESRLLSLYLY